ncbi:MAG: tripartite tricarboxylate transporter permease [Homoserinimonas sp.]
MDSLDGLMAGFASLWDPSLLLIAVVGVILGTLVGVLPGIGPIGAMALLLGFSTQLGPAGSLILFSGIYYGSQYGGSTTSILLNIPGEASSVVTAIDGHQMAKKGRAGGALAIAALSSFAAGTLSVVALTFFAPSLASVAVRLGPPEYFALTVAGLVLLAFLTPGSVVKSLIMVGLGLAVATIGLDQITGQIRFNFGSTELTQGIAFVPLAMGVFGFAEVIAAAVERWRPESVRAPKLRELVPTRPELRRAAWPTVRGSGVGFVSGLIPGPAAIISTFSSYMLEKQISRRKSEFGKGAVEGVAGPEAANNAAATASFVPLMALGIPFAPVMALVLSALLLNGITPGPTFITDHPEVFWVVIAGMYVANAMLLLLNLPLVGLFTRLLAIPPKVLMPCVLVFLMVGAYASNNSSFDIIIMLLAGVVGFLLRRHGFSVMVMVLAVVLAPTLESSLRQSLTLSSGDFAIFLTRPFSATVFGVIACVAVVRLVLVVRNARRSRSVSPSVK